MSPGWPDVALLAYLYWSYRRGRDRGLARELGSLVGLVLFASFLLGLSVTSRLRGELAEIADGYPLTSGLLGFGLAAAGAAMTVRLLRRALPVFVEERLAARARRGWSGVAGLVRAIFFATLILILLLSVPIDRLRQGVLAGSLVGALVHRIFSSVERRGQAGEVGAMGSGDGRMTACEPMRGELIDVMCKSRPN